MSTEYYIIDHPKTLSLDFASLKKEGLAYIQEHMSNSWNNLNSSDPGITILDQLCYALTELGYCNDFPMEDVLTDRFGELQISDQFFLPEDILTTTPITTADIRKLIGDEVDGVDNLIVLPTYNQSGITGIYQLYLRINDRITAKEDIQNICKAAFFLANKARNLGEIFLMPSPLTRTSRFLQGNISISSEASLNTILSAIQQAIDHCIFPKIISVGYDRLTEKKSIGTDEVFNGPRLKNGWIPDEALGVKLDKLRVAELTEVILSVPGVLSATDILYTKPDTNGLYNSASSALTELLYVDIAESVSPPSDQGNGTGLLNIYCNGKQVVIEHVLPPQLIPFSLAQPNIQLGASAVSQTTLPKGKYRDISTYYSIQETFPEIYKVGDNAIISNAGDFQMAQSRQLKGYLTLFDQVLANQFSQLAALGQLFSFKNATSGTPTDLQHYYAIKDRSEIANPKYPVPFRSFSPTYFYQSIYSIPNIEPLLKNNNVFDFGLDPEEEAVVLQQQSWIDYQGDPYNSYMKGLMDYMEDEKVNLKRRNEILNHLLARHGESPALIDKLISGAVYSGGRLKDAVIIKSLYLQNLGLLSYYRPKAHNYLGARRITADTSAIEENFIQKILGWDSIDFITDTEKIDQAEKLQQQDFIDYAAAELKLSLLFGLKTIYKNFFSALFDSGTTDTDDAKIAMWLISQRRGFIFLETSLLNYFVTAHDESGGDVVLLNPNELVMVFPSFIPEFSTASFMNKLDLFIRTEMPVRLKCHYYFADVATFSKIIPAFADWHNCLIYHNAEHIFNKWLVKSSLGLIQVLNTMRPSNNV